MPEQVLVQARVDKKLKDEVSEIYIALGMDLPTAIRMFLVKSKEERGLPFSATLPPLEERITRENSIELFEKMQAVASSYMGDMSDEDIENEIKEARKESKRRQV